MDTQLNYRLAEAYRSGSQKIRVMSENWVAKSVFCPNCGNDTIEQYPNNRPVADFFCSGCNEDYELKSKATSLGTKIVDGAYSTMIERIQGRNNPSLLLLTYTPNKLRVSNLLIIPKHFFTTSIIEKRTPLAPTARRAGWVGCNILLWSIPESGKIFYIRNNEQVPRENVKKQWQKTAFLRENTKLETKGWLLDIMRCMEQLNKTDFTLSDMYAFESTLKALHPGNKHIKDKIRQQLQLLRNKGYLEFTSRGQYHVT